MDTPHTNNPDNNEGAADRRPTTDANYLKPENVRYLLNEAADLIDRKNEQIDGLLKLIEEMEAEMADTETILAERDEAVVKRDAMLADRDTAIAALKGIIEFQRQRLADMEATMLAITVEAQRESLARAHDSSLARYEDTRSWQ